MEPDASASSGNPSSHCEHEICLNKYTNLLLYGLTALFYFGRGLY